ncbi:hypothetical protein HG530_011028 [Fusarium avenaceum]|nr:hypothetical protein HG530_011028 [Fusarium avenaceum]
MFSKIFTTALLVAATVSAAPASKTTRGYPDKTVTLTGVTHSVNAGLGGLRFDPDNVVAEIGDIVEWHFLPMNHSIAQSSFGEPCEPLADGTGFFAGFNFATKEGQAPDVFQLTVEDKKPIWYYCPQQKGNHCQAGMVGVINQNFDNQDFSLRRHKELAALTGVSVIPPVEQGGEVGPNPNPNAQPASVAEYNCSCVFESPRSQRTVEEDSFRVGVKVTSFFASVAHEPVRGDQDNVGAVIDERFEGLRESEIPADYQTCADRTAVGVFQGGVKSCVGYELGMLGNPRRQMEFGQNRNVASFGSCRAQMTFRLGKVFLDNNILEREYALWLVEVGLVHVSTASRGDSDDLRHVHLGDLLLVSEHVAPASGVPEGAHLHGHDGLAPGWVHSVGDARVAGELSAAAGEDEAAGCQVTDDLVELDVVVLED